MVWNPYDERRQKLKEKLEECRQIAYQLLDETMCGYDKMKDGYTMRLYSQIKTAKEMV